MKIAIKQENNISKTLSIISSTKNIIDSKMQSNLPYYINNKLQIPCNFNPLKLKTQ